MNPAAELVTYVDIDDIDDIDDSNDGRLADLKEGSARLRIAQLVAPEPAHKQAIEPMAARIR